MAISFDAISNKQQKVLKTARMQYQAWTLAEIDKFNALMDAASIDKELYRLRDESAKSRDPVVVRWMDFKGVRALFEKAIGKVANNNQLTIEQQAKVGEFVKANWYPIVYQVKHDAAVRHLLHVDQSLLDAPVAKFYNEAFEKAWTQLADGNGMQLSLARMTAEVPKRGLEAFAKRRSRSTCLISMIRLYGWVS